MLNSVEHEILNAHKYKKNIEVHPFLGSDKPRMLVFLLISVKMPAVVGILTFISRKKSFLAELSMKFYSLRSRVSIHLVERLRYVIL